MWCKRTGRLRETFLKASLLLVLGLYEARLRFRARFAAAVWRMFGSYIWTKKDSGALRPTRRLNPYPT